MRKGGGRGMVEVQERLIECSGIGAEKFFYWQDGFRNFG